MLLRICLILIICLIFFTQLSAEDKDSINDYYKITELEEITNGYRITLNNELKFEVLLLSVGLVFPNINDFPVIWIDIPDLRNEFIKLLNSKKTMQDNIPTFEIESITPSYSLQNEQYYDVLFKGGLVLRNIKESRNIMEVFPVDNEGNNLYHLSDTLKMNILQSIMRQSRTPASSRRTAVRTAEPVVVTRIIREDNNMYRIIINNQLTINEVRIERNRVFFPEIEGKSILSFHRQNILRAIMLQITRNLPETSGYGDLEITNITLRMVNRARLKAMADIQFNNTFEINDIRVFFASGNYTISGPSIQRDRKWVELGAFSAGLNRKILEAVQNEISKE